ncbi:unnamed protein product [Brassicogethes aeneus]|uniref:Nuclear factor of activated T-cells 5 n=1 Tax=Brassicogethes aeneus TaxID=1431903 RepID=A0A9P0B7G4_BRAAE|nr:unnamed protein product [Brassicogethes aeneus]
MTLCTVPSVSTPQMKQRRPGRPPGKRVNLNREMPGKLRSAVRRSLDPCDNSNDSGLGFENHVDPNQQQNVSERLTWNSERAEPKRPRIDMKLEYQEENNNYNFPKAVKSCKDSISLIRTAPVGSVPSLSITNNAASSSGRAVPRCVPLSSRQSSSAPVALTTQLTATSGFMDVSLTILKQPEQQHRARYQTEGSRGAVKDRDGNGFPIVQLQGYYKPAILQVFIGTDVGKVAPHMFYQACKVSGKNSTPCIEKKIDGTCVIELQLDPTKEMSATCDCVGILKERNVDVEHRFPEQLGNRSKKKSTRCRMIFRTTVVLNDGTQETLQVCSQPIVCTQPPGVPEICKKSLTSCPANGGLELFVLGKNFLKDTKVYFQQFEDGHVRWENSVVPDKEYLQQTHFVCVIPPYRRPDILEPVSVRLCVVSSGKTSESHQFVYTPVTGVLTSVHSEATQASPQATFFKGMWQTSLSKREQDLDMMPPPESSLVPLSNRRSSISISSNEIHSPPIHSLKQEYIDESSNSSIIDSMDIRHERYRHISESSLDVHHGDSNMSMINDNSIDMVHHSSMMANSLNDNSNLSINDDSVDTIVRRNSLSRPILSTLGDNSLDVNSNMSTFNEDSSCSAVMQSSNSVVTDRLVLSEPVIQQNLINTTEKVIDLRMKMPDLMNSNTPSMATLHRFGMIENTNNTLPTQSAQSIENYLTRIETPKNLLSLNNIPDSSNLQKSLTEHFSSNKLLSSQTSNVLTTTTQALPHFVNRNLNRPVYLSSERQFLTNSTHPDTSCLVSKSEAAAVGENTLIEQTTTITSTTLTSAIDSAIPTLINTDKLDALVNSTVESHIGSPNNTSTVSNKLPVVSTSSNIIISSQDVMLNNQNSLLVPNIINPQMSSPVEEINPTSTIPPEVILNTQISPSLMCHNSNSLSQDTLLPARISSVTQQSLLSSTPVSTNNTLVQPIVTTSLGLATESEKAVLLEAAVDFLQTQKKICELATITSSKSDMLSISSTIPNTVTTNESISQLQGNDENSFVSSQFTTAPSNMVLSKSVTEDCKSDFGIPISVKEISNTVSSEKKNEDRMIPQSFTSLTENELINLINPSCFDQGNANYQ